jgi:hypothetical protein
MAYRILDQVTAAREALATLKPQAALAAQQPAAPAPVPVHVAVPAEPARPEPMEVETQLVPIGQSGFLVFFFLAMRAPQGLLLR